jgi:UDP-N-acetylmuramoyl-tripeptide--D-alanyl-D-alanine ligase
MIEGTLAEAAKTMRGALCGDDGRFLGVSTDTRTIRAGELFFALQGPNFDGNHFVGIATDRNAAAAVVNRAVESRISRIEVDDTRLALGRLASDWRRKMHARVVGITGSNGKTTLKELVTNCLSQTGRTLATQGNLNNDIGVPTMLSRLAPEHRFAVIEMGANHIGEIAYLAALAHPEVVVITNAGPAHLEGFGSIDTVARAKGEILENPIRPSFAVLNADDKYFSYWCGLVRDLEVLSFGVDSDADIRATKIVSSANGSSFTLKVRGESASIALPLAGRHNVANACAAAAAATALGLPVDLIKVGLESARPVSGRLQPIKAASGYIIYNDSYNANPQSVIAAADFLAGQGGDTWLVLGDMAELGADAAILHADVGRAAQQLGVAHFLATGTLAKHAVKAFGEGGLWFESVDALIGELRHVLTEESRVLVKGSRSARMERVVDALQGTVETAGVH